MFKNVTLKAKLFLQAIFLTLLMLIVGFFGVKGIQVANTGTLQVYEGGVDSLEYLDKLRMLFTLDVDVTAQKIRDEDISWGEGAYIMTQALANIPKYLDDYTKTLDDPGQAHRLKVALDKGKATIEKLLGLIKKEEREPFISYIKNELYPAIIPIVEEINTVAAMHIAETKSDYDSAKENSHYFQSLMIIMLIAAILAGALFSVFTIRSITIPLSTTVEAINQVAMGNHAIQLDVDSHNEIGNMLSALKRMIESIHKMTIPLVKVSQGDLTGNVEVRSEYDILAHSINDMIAKLREMISEIQGEIIVIANSAEEVTASISEVSTGTTETAAAVTETTTTVEELQQTAQVSSSKAEDVLNSSEETIKIVKTSELSLKNTIEDMAHIQEKMNVISESIVKLSEHSLTIGDIITTVNELAEQSNLLAVNAAIEAAKAGEQGKGFGVVAQEIRTLAEQSKAATSQVRSILNDIQNATSTAVMATEQGSKAVGKGVKQSQETNTAMQSLISNIAQVSQAAKQIAISSQQQLIGVAQVKTAMSNINLASEQHVEHMKQIETAISSLNEVSKNLKRLISQYKISTSA